MKKIVTLNTPFDEVSEDTEREMTELWATIFSVAMQQNLPVFKTMLWLNDNFEDVYWSSETDTEVWQTCFKELGILWKPKKPTKGL